jgi:hypothetical protein
MSKAFVLFKIKISKSIFMYYRNYLTNIVRMSKKIIAKLYIEQ